MQKYKANLRIEGNKVYSYNTHVATIDCNKLLVHGYWSMTTTKHVNYVAKEYGLQIADSKALKDAEPKPESNPFKTVALIASLGKIIGGAETVKEENDWKKRMLTAGMGSAGLSFPDDWDSLTEEEKARRLDGAIDIQLNNGKKKGGKK